MGYATVSGEQPPKPAKRRQRASATKAATEEANRKSPAAAVDSSAGNAHKHRQDVVMRLKRVEGQIRGVLAMIDQGSPCDAIAQQLAAARKALDRAFYEMMACDIEQEIGSTSDPVQLGRRLAEKTRLLAKYS